MLEATVASRRREGKKDAEAEEKREEVARGVEEGFLGQQAARDSSAAFKGLVRFSIDRCSKKHETGP